MLQKVWFTSGGVIFNFILAFILFSGITFFNGRSIPENSTIIGQVVPDQPAYLSGMMNGDKIISINDLYVNDWDDIKRQKQELYDGGYFNSNSNYYDLDEDFADNLYAVTVPDPYGG